jgi:hypothetical protein
MRRAIALCAATGIALSALALVPAQATYDNTGFCQIWDQGYTVKPWSWPSPYKTVSKPVPTVTEALSAKDSLMKRGTCLR